jgi:hypothetical protein
LIFYCGRTQFPWSSLKALVTELNHIEDTRVFQHPLATAIKASDAVRLYNQRNLWSRLPDRQSTFSSEFELFELLEAHRDAECTDIRDRVFGVLGPTSGSCSSTDRTLIPIAADYSLSAMVLYANVVGHYYITRRRCSSNLLVRASELKEYGLMLQKVFKLDHLDELVYEVVYKTLREDWVGVAQKEEEKRLQVTAETPRYPTQISNVHGVSYRPSSHYYAGLQVYEPDSVQLRLDRSFTAMRKKWTLEEYKRRHRLVQVRQYRRRNVVRARFTPVASSSNMSRWGMQLPIHCLYWKKKNHKFYVVDTDAMLLLEFLLEHFFTNEEKDYLTARMKGLKTVPPVSYDTSLQEPFHSWNANSGVLVRKGLKLFPWSELSVFLRRGFSLWKRLKSKATPKFLVYPVPENAESEGDESDDDNG